MSILSEDKPDFEKLFANWFPPFEKGAIDAAEYMWAKYVEPERKENAELRLKLKEKEQEIEELTELRGNGAHNCSLLMVQLGEEKVKISKLEQSNKALIEALKWYDKKLGIETGEQHPGFKTLIKSEGTTKKE